MAIFRDGYRREILQRYLESGIIKNVVLMRPKFKLYRQSDRP